MDNKEYIIGIDIGSSNVVMAAGTREDNGEVSLLAVDVQPIEGCVKDGDIINYVDLGKSIAKAKAEVEKELNRRINSAYVGISGRSVYCIRYEDYVDVNSPTGCITENDIRELTARIEMVVSAGGDEIVERIPLRYIVDDNQEVKNPIGAFGKRLSATYLFVLVAKHQIDRVDRALHHADIRDCGLCVNPSILPHILLSNDEMEEGTAIVDIGNDLTDISIVKGGKLWHMSSLPIGAASINNDLHDFLKISRKEVETIKRRHGGAVADEIPDNTAVSVKTAGNAKKQILHRNIVEIMEERLKDIAGYVLREIKAGKFLSKIPCGVVLTGASAYIQNIDKLFARELHMEVRMGKMLNGLDDDSQQKASAYPQSAAIGLLLYGAKHAACDTLPGILNGEPPVPPTPPTPPTPSVPSTPQTPPTPPTPPVPPTPPAPPTPNDVDEDKGKEVEVKPKDNDDSTDTPNSSSTDTDNRDVVNEDSESTSNDKDSSKEENSSDDKAKEEKSATKEKSRKGIGRIGEFMKWIDRQFRAEEDTEL